MQLAMFSVRQEVALPPSPSAPAREEEAAIA